MIVAVVPAAGLSTRMGGSLPKPLLPWNDVTVIEQVVRTLLAAGVDQVTVVTGHLRAAMDERLAVYPVRSVYNANYRNGEMLSSVQAGLRAMPAEADGALLALADQPQMELAVVRSVIASFEQLDGERLVIPSYQMRRGHPIALPRRLWPEILALPAGETLRTLIARHADSIRYVPVDTASVLADLDTPQQYRDARSAQERS